MSSMSGDLVIGPCPGCHDWSLQFSPTDASPAEVQRIVAEHARLECPALSALVIETVFNAGPNRQVDLLVGMDLYLVADGSAPG